MDVLRANKSVKKLTIFPLAILCRSPQYQGNAHTKFGENPLICTKVIIQK